MMAQVVIFPFSHLVNDKIISVKWQSVSASYRIPIVNTTTMVDRRTSRPQNIVSSTTSRGASLVRVAGFTQDPQQLNFSTRIIFMATYKETDWDQIRNEEVCKKKNQLPYQLVQNYLWKHARRRRMVWETLQQTWPEMELNSKRNDEKFGRKWHPAFRCSNPFSRDALKSRGGEIILYPSQCGSENSRIVVENN